MELSRRLAAIAEMVEEGSRLADVGTDHGYLPIWLVKTEKIPCAVAMDIGEGPLSRARDHVKAFGLEDRIRPVSYTHLGEKWFLDRSGRVGFRGFQRKSF